MFSAQSLIPDLHWLRWLHWWLRVIALRMQNTPIRVGPVESQASGFTVNATGRAPSAQSRPVKRRERQTAKVWFSKQQQKKTTWGENVLWGKCLHADERSRETERERRGTPDSDSVRYSNDSSGNSLRWNLAESTMTNVYATRRCDAWQSATQISAIRWPLCVDFFLQQKPFKLSRSMNWFELT